MKMGMGNIAFMVGFFGSILLGLLSGLEIFTAGPWLTMALIIAGVIIGIMNITDKESVSIMIAALVIGGGAGVLAGLEFVGGIIAAILSAMASVILPVGIVVAVKVFMTKAN